MATGVGKPNTRTLYISSEDVDWYQSSDVVTVNIPQSIVPDDGYMLAYALKSLGLNTSVMNISHTLRNNRMTVRLGLDISEIQYYPDRDDDFSLSALDKKEWEIPERYPMIPSRVTKINEGQLEVDYPIIVPDGLYSLTDLFSYLSGSTDHDFHIPFPYYYNFSNSTAPDLDLFTNIFRAKFQFQLTPSGFKIGLVNSRSTSPQNSFTITDTNYTRAQLFPKVLSVTLMPDRHAPLLFNTLFTNYNSSNAREPISARAFEGRTGMNPPLGIQFKLSKGGYVQISELGNLLHYMIPAGTYPTGEKVNRNAYIAYNRPLLDPLYVDINISLPNHSIDGRGETNRLARIFTLGNLDSTSKSYFRQWDNPKITTMDSVSGFHSVTVQFTSEGGKWDFFNLEFAIELEIYQVLIESMDDPSRVAGEMIRTMPDDDPVTRAIANTPELSRTRENHYSTHSREGGLVKRARHEH